MKKLITIHPLLFALFPVLALYFFNMDQIAVTQILPPAIVTMLGAAILWVMLSLMLKGRERAALLVSPFIVLFLSYGNIYSYIGYLMDKTKWYLIVAVFAFVSLVILTAYLWFCRTVLRSTKSSTIISLNKIFTVVAILLIVFNLFQIGTNAFISSKAGKSNKLDCTSVGTMSMGPKPDIYYLLLDGYAGFDQMKTVYNYDNSPFATKLAERGFYVAKKSESKFVYTALSVASSLNMEQARSLDKSDPRLLALVRNNKVSQILKCQGYKYITFGSWWHTTAYNPYADLHFNLFGFRLKNELTSLLVRSSIINLLFIHRDFYRKSTLAVFDEMPGIVDTDSPKFVFAHIACPHDPLVFGPNGEKISFKDSTFSLRKSLYLGQFIFVTKKIDKLINDILARSKNPPIIVVQSDHGIKNTVGSPNQIFNAYYLPGEGSKLLYESISPVNTFRLILNHYFNGTYDLLPD